MYQHNVYGEIIMDPLFTVPVGEDIGFSARYWEKKKWRRGCASEMDKFWKCFNKTWWRRDWVRQATIDLLRNAYQDPLTELYAGRHLP